MHTGERHVLRFLDGLARATRPLVAAVQGNAVGVGTTMLLHCDLVYVADTARLITPFVNLALVPEAASSLLMPARIGYARAFAMFALGEAIEPPPRWPSGSPMRWCRRPICAPPRAAAAEALAKRPAGRIGPYQGADARCRRHRRPNGSRGHDFQERLKSAEAREAFAAFAERRPPDSPRSTG